MLKFTFKHRGKWILRIFASIAFSLHPVFAKAQDPSLEGSQENQELTDVQWQKAWEEMIQGNGKGWNLELPTLGGKQFWTDHRWWHGVRLQYNHTLDHWRVIDPSAIRKGWGSKEAMLEVFEEIKSKQAAASDRSTAAGKEPKTVYLLLHGLMRSSSSMKPVEQEILKRLAEEPSESIAIIRFQYASTRASIASHAEALRELVENLPGKPRIKIAGHSLGNIVTRLAIAQWREQGDPQGVLGRIDRVVMMGPPNQGSSFAKRLSQLGLFEMITGKSGMQLGPHWEGLSTNLGAPPCPFMIIAGDLTGTSIQNPLLSGPNDAVVTVQEAKLEGMAEFKTFPVLHSFLMQDARCVEAGVDFLLK
ncbi:MAG: esterase/lipase family protein [Planctomycetota bacterium]